MFKVISSRNLFIFRKFNKLLEYRELCNGIHLKCNNKHLSCAIINQSNVPYFDQLRIPRSKSPVFFKVIRTKYSKSKAPSNSKQNEDSDSDDDEAASFKEEKDSKIVKTTVNSLRTDLLVKAGLGISRNKVETLFYESKIRVNGKKIPKKSMQLNVGDEIDVIKGFSTMNPQHLVISRIIILSAKEKDENLSVQLRRYKNLITENYEGCNAYKSSSSDDN